MVIGDGEFTGRYTDGNTREQVFEPLKDAVVPGNSSWVTQDLISNQALPRDWFIITEDGSRVALKQKRLLDMLTGIRGKLCHAISRELCGCSFGDSGCAEISLTIALIERMPEDEYIEIFGRDLDVVEGLNEVLREVD